MGLTKATSEERHFPYEPYISAHTYYLYILACTMHSVVIIAFKRIASVYRLQLGVNWYTARFQLTANQAKFVTRNIKLLQTPFQWVIALNQPMQIKVQFQTVESFLDAVNLILPYLVSAVKLCNNFYPLNLQHLRRIKKWQR